MGKLGRYSADRKKIENLTADKTVQVSDCGTIFTLGVATGLTASLPNASDAGKGWWCKFIVATDITDASYTYQVAVTSGDNDNLSGVTTATSGGFEAGLQLVADGTNGTAVDLVDFTSASKVGDQLELVTDGTNWYALGHSYAYTAITYS